MRDNLPNMLRAAAKEWREENKVVATGATRYDAALEEAADAIEELQQMAAHYEETAKDYFKDVCYYLERVPKWIPVTERLPERKKAHYLCLLDDDSMAVVYWSRVSDWASKGEWTWHNPNWKEVTHWMPLPAPPKEETE